MLGFFRIGHQMATKQLLDYAVSGIGRIATRKAYLDDVQTCLSQDACPAKSLGIDHASWKKMLDEADDIYTYCDPSSAIVKSFDAIAGYKGLDGESEIPDRALLVFDAILATKDKDRDGDIVHPEGLALTYKMPLLWQHVWSSPVGVMVKTLEQNTEHNVNRYAIADTVLGKDAATLTAMGALRMSHGFLPVPGEFEPLELVKSANGTMVPSGFRIKKANVYESSLVSVPAGAKASVLRTYEKEFDAICQAVSEKKLQSTVVKSWAENLYENRTKVFSGATLEPQKVVVEVNVNHEKPEPVPTVVKSFSASHEKMMSMAVENYMPGSFEDIQDKLQKQAQKALSGRYEDKYVSLLATFSDSFVVCTRKYDSGDVKKECYRSTYEMDGDDVKIGEMKEVEIAVSVMEKAFSGMQPEQEPIEVAPPVNVTETDPVLALFV